MKQITQAEFEALVQSLIDGKTTRKKLAKSLDTDIRTLNNKTTELSNSNPSLYEEYVKKFPYKPKTREDIDYEALIIYTMKNAKTLDEVSEDCGVSRRTIARRIRKMEDKNSEIAILYRKYADSLKRRIPLPIILQKTIDDLDSRPVILSTTSTGVKESELRETLQRFEELLGQGMSKAQAARTLGYDDYPTIWKKQQELKRIETEKAVMQQEDSKTKKFRESMKINSPKATNPRSETVAKKDMSTQNKVKEGR